MASRSPRGRSPLNCPAPAKSHRHAPRVSLDDLAGCRRSFCAGRRIVAGARVRSCAGGFVNGRRCRDRGPAQVRASSGRANGSSASAAEGCRSRVPGRGTCRAPARSAGSTAAAGPARGGAHGAGIAACWRRAHPCSRAPAAITDHHKLRRVGLLGQRRHAAATARPEPSGPARLLHSARLCPELSLGAWTRKTPRPRPSIFASSRASTTILWSGPGRPDGTLPLTHHGAPSSGHPSAIGSVP